MARTDESAGRAETTMRPADAFFWYAEMATPELRPLVAGLFLLDRTPDRRRLRDAIERLTLTMPRLRQHVVEAPLGLGLPLWRPSGRAFDLDYHLRHVVLPPPADDRALLRYAGEVFSAPLDHLRPLWEAQLIGGLPGGRAALFIKLHHALLDGASATALFDALTQPRRTGRPPAPPPPVQRTVDEAPPLVQLAHRARTVATGGAQALVRGLTNPADVLREAASIARGASGMVSSALSALSAGEPDQPYSVGRRLDGRVLSLARMRRLKDALGATLNDLVLTAVAGAVGHYRARHALDAETVSCMVPVNLRRQEPRRDTELGNRVGGFVVQLPAAEADPLRRLERIQLQTRRAKHDRHGSAYGVFMQAAALVPAAVFRGIAQRVSGRVQLICSNVPGPTTLRYLAGAKIDAVYPFAPMIFGIPLAIALASYGPTYCVGIASDPAVYPDPEVLGDLLEREVDAIERRVRRGRSAAVTARRAADTRRADRRRAGRR